MPPPCHLYLTALWNTLRAVSPTFEHIADRIRFAMDRRGLTQRELSRRAGLAETQVSVILVRLRERPYAIELETLARIAAGAEVPLLWLMTGLDEGEVNAPVPLAKQPGWSAALQGAMMLRPDVLPWAWDWVGRTRLPSAPGVAPSPSLLLDLAVVAARQFGHDAVHRPAPEAYQLPPISKRPRAPKGAAAVRKPAAKKAPRRRG